MTNESNQPTDDTSMPASPAAAMPEAGEADRGPAHDVPKIKIGSQRPGTPRVKAVAKQVLQETSHGHAPKTPVPNRRAAMPDDLEAEINAALEGMSLNELVDPLGGSSKAVEFEPEARKQGRVLKVYQGDVFVDLGGPDQGVLPLAQFAALPAVGSTIEVVVNRFNAEDGMYQLTLPNRPLEAGDWSQVSDGMIVEARVTGHNKGGLEADVGSLKGFIPAGQVAVYRVEDFSQFVGEKWACLVTECNPERRRLVLSRRSVIEREKAEARERLLAELQVGDVREGLVTRIQDFGAFVDLGGVDGLLHISRLAWQRVKHPSEVLQVGQKVKVKVTNIDADTGKIGLSLRDLLADPWVGITLKYKQGDVIRGPVVRVLDKVGAFVQLEPGIDGMVHISELAHQRAWRVDDFVKEGQEVEAKVLAVDPDQKRISLSMKALMLKPEPVKKEPDPEEVAETTPAAPLPQQPKKLKGGIGKKSGGAQFGLKW